MILDFKTKSLHSF